MAKVREFKTKAEKFEEWKQAVFQDAFFLQKESVKSVLICWEDQDEKGEPMVMHARFNVDPEQLDWFKRAMEDQLFNLKLDKYMRDNLI